MKVDVKTVQLKINSVEYTFNEATYNGMVIIVEKNSKYINAGSFCKQYNKRLGRLFETSNWKEFITEFELEYKDELEGQTTMANLPPWSFKLNKGIPDSLKKIRGLYVHPKLINYIAIWCSPKYAITVGKIMDSINESIHQQMKKENLPDSVEVSKRLYDDMMKKCIEYNMLIHQQEEDTKRANSHDVYCWGVRD